MNARIPGAIAVALWGAAALAVAGYTYKAYKETADGSSGTPQIDPATKNALDLAQNAPALVPMQTLLPPTQPDRPNFGGAQRP